MVRRRNAADGLLDDVGSMDPAYYGVVAQAFLYATCAQLVNYPDKAGPAGSQLTAEVAQSLPEALGRR